MKTLAVFSFFYDPTELIFVFENGMLMIDDDRAFWQTYANHYTRAKDATSVIRYYRIAQNWEEIEL